MKITDLRTVAVRVPVERPTAIATRRLGAGYYRPGDPLDNIREEMLSYKAQGFTDFKIKVGGAAFEVDVARVCAATPETRLRPQDGVLPLPTAPGIGIAFDEPAIQRWQK